MPNADLSKIERSLPFSVIGYTHPSISVILLSTTHPSFSLLISNTTSGTVVSNQPSPVPHSHDQ